jgi:heat shock protein HtpX
MPAFCHIGAFKRASDRQYRRMLMLLAAMVGLLLACAWALGGGPLVVAALATVTLGLGGICHLPATAIMTLHQAVPLTAPSRPDLAATVAGLAARAGLARTPALYRLPDGSINALAAGCPGHTAIGLSDDSLTLLSGRELRAILAHEVAHLAAGDTRLLAVTCLISQITQGTAQVALVAGLVLAIVSGTAALSVFQVVMFTLSVPAISLLRLALSRNREFAADLGAIRLTDDPIGLVAALERIEALEDHSVRHPTALTRLLRSHPPPQQRISRLLRRIYRAPPEQPPLTQPVLPQPMADRWHLVQDGAPSSAARAAEGSTAPVRLRRSGGLTIPPDITTLSPSSTVMSSTSRSLRGTNSR